MREGAVLRPDHRMTRPLRAPRSRASTSDREQKLKSPTMECARHDDAAAKPTACGRLGQLGRVQSEDQGPPERIPRPHSVHDVVNLVRLIAATVAGSKVHPVALAAIEHSTPIVVRGRETLAKRDRHPGQVGELLYHLRATPG